MQMTGQLRDAANRYAEALSIAQSLGVSAEPEAQLTVPISNLFTIAAATADLGDLQLIREAQLEGVRPDFAVLHRKRPCGWMELKAPGHTLVGEKWRGREKRQWELLTQLDSLIVSNGSATVLYREGSEVAHAGLPIDGADSWDPHPFFDLLQLFIAGRPITITRVSQLSRKLALLARLLRRRLHEGAKTQAAGFPEAIEAWEVTIQRPMTIDAFATDVAQVVSYAMAIAALNGGADRNGDGLISIDEARNELRQGPNNVLAAALGPILGVPEVIDYAYPEIAAIERLVSAIDSTAVTRNPDPRGEPWLWFYEDFLAIYDPAARSQAGVYYTPTSVVQAQTRLVDDILRHHLERSLGFGTRSVVTLDPATGSGTYPLAIIDHAVEVAEELRGPAGPNQVAHNLLENLAAFELLPGPYAVAHLRIGQRLAEISGHWHQLAPIRVYLTDTLEGPEVPVQKGLFGDARVLADEAAKARRIKHDEAVTVVIGNPPYDRVDQKTSGGWVLHPDGGRPLFKDVIEPAQKAGVIFSAQASLYNQYVYFWRWAMWKAFEEHPDQAAVVSFITAASWLQGDVFCGLRELASDYADEIWVIDLGGEGRGARVEENIFAIQTPVAIVTMFRRAGTRARKGTAKTYYRRIYGTGQEKLACLDEVRTPRQQLTEWTVIERTAQEPLAPIETTSEWFNYPALTDLFPWQQPGMMAGRAWNVSPSPAVLERRWQVLLEDPGAEARAAKYVTPNSGRTIHTKVRALAPLASLPPEAPHEPLVRTAWRSFDRQWTFRDPRLIKTESPSLWNSLSDQQIFLVGLLTIPLGEGPALTVAVDVPDKHYFRNSYGGKDVIPLYRDAAAVHPNITGGLLDQLAQRFNREVAPEDLASYTYALLAHSGYTKTFHEELARPGPRVPLTQDPDLFFEAVELGCELLWVQTYGQRFNQIGDHTRAVLHCSAIGWRLPVTHLPDDPKEISYDLINEELLIGDGVVTGVRSEVRNFSVSGMNILDRWLGARTRKGIGLAAGASATPLDRIRPLVWEDEWNDDLLDLLHMLTRSVDLSTQQDELLQRVLEGPMFIASQLPQPAPEERSVPKEPKTPRLL